LERTQDFILGYFSARAVPIGCAAAFGVLILLDKAGFDLFWQNQVGVGGSLPGKK